MCVCQASHSYSISGSRSTGLSASLVEVVPEISSGIVLLCFRFVDSCLLRVQTPPTKAQLRVPFSARCVYKLVSDMKRLAMNLMFSRKTRAENRPVCMYNCTQATRSWCQAGNLKLVRTPEA